MLILYGLHRFQHQHMKRHFRKCVSTAYSRSLVVLTQINVQISAQVNRNFNGEW